VNGIGESASGGPSAVVSVRSLLEQVAAVDHVKHLAGEVKSFQELLQPANLDRLAKASPGGLAYLAFHPTADSAIADYIKGGSLASDSGRGVLVLFTTSVQVWSTTSSDDPALFTPPPAGGIPGLTVDAGIHPSYEMIRLLFEPKPPPPLPGIALFKDFSADSDVVFASLAEDDTSFKVTQSLRKIFAIVESVGVPQTASKFADAVSVALQQQRIPHQQSGGTSVREWFVRSYQFLWDNKSDIVAVAGLIPLK